MIQIQCDGIDKDNPLLLAYMPLSTIYEWNLNFSYLPRMMNGDDHATIYAAVIRRANFELRIGAIYNGSTDW